MTHAVDGVDPSGPQGIEPSPLESFQSLLFLYTATVQYGNHHTVVNAMWQNACNAFESAVGDPEYVVPDYLRSGVFDNQVLGNSALWDALPMQLVLAEGHHIFPATDEESDQAFASLLKDCFDSRVSGKTTPGGRQTFYQAKFDVSQAVNAYLDSLNHTVHKPSNATLRLNRIVELAGLTYHPISGRALKAGSLAARMLERALTA